MAIRVAQTSLAAAVNAQSANEPAPTGAAEPAGDSPSTPPLHVVERAGGRGGPQDRAMLQILQFVVAGGDADGVADRAVASLGLLPEVLWAELDGDGSTAPGRLTMQLGSRRLTVQLADPSDLDTQATVEGLVTVIASMHKQQREMSRLRDEAHTDPLTGLFNRRGFGPFLEQALARAARSGEEIAVLICDVDRFKQVNDTHGHDAGDRALLAVAEAMSSVIRPSDIAARIGGDELVILLSGANASGATVVAGRLRRALRSAKPPAPGVRIPTLSIGIADTRVLTGARTGAEARGALMRAADKALYSAKEAGRDRWVCHPSCFTPTEVLEDHSTLPIALKSA